MSKKLFPIVLVLLTVSQAGSVLAGAIDNKSNHSAAFVRSYTRNHVTDAPDAAIYNPAGLVKMPEGLYVELNNQFLPKTLSHSYDGKTFEDTTPVLLYPSAYIVYRLWKMAGYFAFSPIAGGGSVEYPKGTGRTDDYLDVFQPKTLGKPGEFGIFGKLPHIDPQVHAPTQIISDATEPLQSVNAESMVLGFTVGAAYEVLDWLSVGVGARMLYAKGDASLGLGYGQSIANSSGTDRYRADFVFDVDYGEDAFGVGGIFSLCFTPTDKLNIGLRYEMETKLEYSRSVDVAGTIKVNPALAGQISNDYINKVSDALVTEGKSGLGDGFKYKRNLPETIALGISYDVLPDLRLATAFNYYIQTTADWQSISWGTIKDATGFADAWEWSGSIEYEIMPEVKASIGYDYFYYGIEDGKKYTSYATLESPALNGHAFGLGASWQAMEDLTVNLGLSYIYYVPATVEQSYGPTPEGKDDWTWDEMDWRPVELERTIWDVGLGVTYKIL